MEIELASGDELTLNQEINIYQTDYIEGAKGFASLRTIFAYGFLWSSREVSIAYLNDYREDKVPQEMRHVLLLSLTLN
ncbi:MAG: hypothetical protein AAF202_02165 [Pseudomonadota bacterium]